MDWAVFSNLKKIPTFIPVSNFLFKSHRLTLAKTSVENTFLESSCSDFKISIKLIVRQILKKAWNYFKLI